ncbi:hypothetical protein FGG90_14300 [Clavibacter tessellarius]|uniref:Uncharacterized protein n=1 Tax=Clavibacter tessellarius TaxID=31965 RepID=A0A225CJP0_9MICO|nr:hypothetical protein [Clavibacter michiganensis]OQJ61962.1 hypothetical protein B5P24_02415 [Clavibacter michiganensis subsp. tessellarius]UKF35041.1 hypothetical protein FGG90_14300 [Clavibacter michiganensis subsp. tessellarius]
MSIRSRAARSLTPRTMLAHTALTAVAVIGLVIAAPGSDAFAAGLASPQERVAASLEHGHFLDDVSAGRITEADVDIVSTTGMDVFGHHVDKWAGLTPEEEATQGKAVAEFRASAATDPETAESIASLRSASAQMDSALASAPDGTSTTSYRPAPLSGDAPVAESKHWWSRFIPHIHINVPKIIHRIQGIIGQTPNILQPIAPQWVFFNNALIRSVMAAAGSTVAGLVCAAFPDLTKITCVMIAGAAAGLLEFVKTNGICGGHGASMHIPLPDIRFHCGH